MVAEKIITNVTWPNQAIDVHDSDVWYEHYATSEAYIHGYKQPCRMFSDSDVVAKKQ